MLQSAYLFEKRILLEAAAAVLHANASFIFRHPQLVYPRAWKPRSTCSSGLACHAHACCACPSAPSQRRHKSAGCARKAAPRHARYRTPLLRVNCANAAAVVAPPQASSDFACLPLVPGKQRLCSLSSGPSTQSPLQ